MSFNISSSFGSFIDNKNRRRSSRNKKLVFRTGGQEVEELEIKQPSAPSNNLSLEQVEQKFPTSRQVREFSMREMIPQCPLLTKEGAACGRKTIYKDNLTNKNIDCSEYCGQNVQKWLASIFQEYDPVSQKLIPKVPLIRITLPNGNKEDIIPFDIKVIISIELTKTKTKTTSSADNQLEFSISWNVEERDGKWKVSSIFERKNGKDLEREPQEIENLSGKHFKRLFNTMEQYRIVVQTTRKMKAEFSFEYNILPIDPNPETEEESKVALENTALIVAAMGRENAIQVVDRQGNPFLSFNLPESTSVIINIRGEKVDYTHSYGVWSYDPEEILVDLNFPIL